MERMFWVGFFSLLSGAFALMAAFFVAKAWPVVGVMCAGCAGLGLCAAKRELNNDEQC